MSGWLIDTNVLSELRKQKRCDAGVWQWFQAADAEELFISVMVLGEIRQGIERFRHHDLAQSRVLERWLAWVETEFADRALPVDKKIADEWGRLRVRQPIPILDGIMAATAIVHGLTVVTRDEKGFRDTGTAVLNPFSKPTSN